MRGRPGRGGGAQAQCGVRRLGLRVPDGTGGSLPRPRGPGLPLRATPERVRGPGPARVDQAAGGPPPRGLRCHGNRCVYRRRGHAARQLRIPRRFHQRRPAASSRAVRSAPRPRLGLAPRPGSRRPPRLAPAPPPAPVPAPRASCSPPRAPGPYFGRWRCGRGSPARKGGYSGPGRASS